MMGSLLSEKGNLEDNDSPLPTCKRQKLSAVRKFPRGYGPNAEGEDLKKLREAGKDITEAEGEELKNISTEIPNRFKDIQNDPKELPDVANNMGKGTNEAQCLSPVWQERKYPSPRRVSAVCKFPAGCGRNLTSLGQTYQVVEAKTDTKMHESCILNQNEKSLEEGKKREGKIWSVFSKKSDDAHENPPEVEVVAKRVLIRALTGQSSELKAQENPSEVDERVIIQALTGIPSELKAQEYFFEDYKDMENSGYAGEYDCGVRSSSYRLINGIMVLVEDKDKKISSSTDGLSSNIELQGKTIAFNEAEKGVVVLGLTYAASYQLNKVKKPAKLSPSRFGEKESLGNQDRPKRSLTKRKDNARQSVMEKDEAPRQIYLGDDKDHYCSEDEENDAEFLSRPHNSDVTLLPFVACSSNERGARTKVRETLRLFQVIVRKILQEEETNSKEGKAGKWAHLRAANVLKEKGKYINTEKRIGAVPGVEIGDIFSYRLELAIIGLHSPLQSGIDTIKHGNDYFAISVVASEGYDNDLDDPNVLIYTGHGGNLTSFDKQPEDQKLERGNLALRNCIDKKNPVRVIRGFKEMKLSDNGDGKSKMITTYTYDGLYIVERYWHEVGPHGNLIYKFELIRMPGQDPLAWKEVKQSKKYNTRKGLCVDDISKGKEKTPICAVNTVDDEKPPPFTYITSTIYPDWCRPLPLKGCDCKTDCSNSIHCACAVKNAGEIPYNLSGAIVEAKTLVYECGPSCNCPPSCSNRVSQRGIKLPLEIFKTESMGWGVRCLSFIPSGSFICEYIGELLDEREAEQRVGSDEYLFDIGNIYNEAMPKVAGDVVANVGFTIDAANYGNIGRFLNHSCSPNLYAQNVLYDHEDERIPHVMLFAAENIPPLQELTYHYNYSIGEVYDSNGKVKSKDCYCGSVECDGRMY